MRFLRLRFAEGFGLLGLLMAGCHTFEKPGSSDGAFPGEAQATALSVQSPSETPTALVIPERFDTATRESLKILSECRSFSSDQVGYAGETPPAVLAWRQIYANESDSAEAYSFLIEQADIPGKLFGLCGLYLVAPAAYQVQAHHFLAMETEIQTRQGCFIIRKPVHEIVTSTYGDLDIASGAYPRMFQADLKTAE